MQLFHIGKARRKSMGVENLWALRGSMYKRMKDSCLGHVALGGSS